MLRLRYSKRSRADVDDIAHFIAVDSPRNAEAMLDHLHTRIEQLRGQPRLGHRRGLRCINRDGYMIFYRHSAIYVLVVRIIHRTRHLPGVSFDPLP